MGKFSLWGLASGNQTWLGKSPDKWINGKSIKISGTSLENHPEIINGGKWMIFNCHVWWPEGKMCFFLSCSFLNSDGQSLRSLETFFAANYVVREPLWTLCSECILQSSRIIWALSLSNLSIYPPIHLSIYPSIYLSTYLSGGSHFVSMGTGSMGIYVLARDMRVRWNHWMSCTSGSWARQLVEPWM